MAEHVGHNPIQRTGNIVAQSVRWLNDLENAKRVDSTGNKWKKLGSDAHEQLAMSLRQAILRCAPAFPDPTIKLYQQAVAAEHLRDAYGTLMAYAHVMAAVAPDAVIELAKSELLQELPATRFAREEERRKSAERRKSIREIPEAERTPRQQHVTKAVASWTE